MTTVSKGIRDKAERLLVEQKVVRVNLNTYTVQGDTNFYTVSVTDASECIGVCECSRWSIGHRVCSHLYAACEQALLDVDRFEGQTPRQQIVESETERWKTEDPFDGLT